jgi:acyl-CoA oxidase
MERVNRTLNHVSPSPTASHAASQRFDPAMLRSKGIGKPTFDIAKVTHILDHDHHDARQKMREFLKDPIYTPVYNVSMKYQRDVALERLRKICESGFISVTDFKQ